MLVFQLYLSVNFFESLSHLRFSEISANNSGKLWIDTDILCAAEMVQLHILYLQPKLIIIDYCGSSHDRHIFQHLFLDSVHPGNVHSTRLHNPFLVVVDESGQGVRLQVF